MADAGDSYEGVIRWLSKAGLSRYVPRFLAEKVTDEAFKNLQVEDYARVGIDAAADKHKLTKLIRQLNPQAPRVSTSRGDADSQLSGGRDEGSQDLSDDDFLSEAGLPLDDSLPRIRVLVRKRPLNTKERARRDEDVVVVQSPGLTVHEPRTKVDLTRYTECHSFTFDEVLDEDATNDQVYASAVEPLISVVFQRGRATCFAYGQTGSGKTHTMQPLPVRAARQILDTVASSAAMATLRLGVSFFEIYGGKVFDLLSDRRKLCIRESGTGEICVVGLREYPVADVSAVSALIERGNAARSTGSTGANADSSRSHAILQLTLRRRVPGEALGGPSEEGNGATPLGRTHGKFSFIDLAGSERGADTSDNDRQTRLEGAEINKSLLALKECIRALDQDRAGGGGRHIPFRGSKLTEVLRDSFGGDGRTVMIANISPAASNCEHTLNTLRYADRVKELRSGAHVGRSSSNEDLPSGAAVAQQQPQLRGGGVSPERRPAPPRPASVGGGVRASLAGRPSVSPVAPPDPARPVSRQAPPRRVSAGELLQPPGKVRPPVPPAQARPASASVPAAPPAPLAPLLSDAGDEEDALLAAAHDELMHTILEEEEVVIGAHRKQIEDTMESVRVEMALLQEVDRPGSAIDDYVSGLTAILAARAASIAELQARLATFQRHLKEEEILSRTVVSKRLSLPADGGAPGRR